MKKIFYPLWILISLCSIVMCSKSGSIDDEKNMVESLQGNEKVVLDPEKMETELVNLVNEHRASVGASELQVSPSAYVHAKDHNDYMISKNQLSHDNFQERASKVASETNAVEVSENVARYYSTEALALEGWLNSASHKSTLEGDFTHTTLSIQLDKNGRAYYTQLFMRVEAPGQ